MRSRARYVGGRAWMDEPTRFPEIRAVDYDTFAAGFRRVKEHFGLSDNELDSLAGLADGHSGKLLGPSRERGFGASTLDAFLAALPVDLVFVISPSKLARFRAGEPKKRRSSHVRDNSRVSRDAVHRVMSELGRKRMAALRASGLLLTFAGIGGLSRAAKLSPEKRKAIAKAASKTRWRKHRIAEAQKAKAASGAKRAKAA